MTVRTDFEESEHYVRCPDVAARPAEFAGAAKARVAAMLAPPAGPPAAQFVLLREFVELTRPGGERPASARESLAAAEAKRRKLE